MIVETVDRAEVRRTLGLLFPTPHVFEIRALDASAVRCNGRPEGRNATFFGFFDSTETAANVVHAALSGADWTGAYVTMNPVRSDLLARAANRLRQAGKKGGSASDVDVPRRRLIVLDFDPVRPAGISSTDDEKAAAQVLAHRVRLYLSGIGWPEPIVADSGNGWHLLYAVDLPGADGGLVKACLEALAARFDSDETKVDTTVFNPARITKLYGTLARKGDDTPERPHRMSRIIEVPDRIENVPEELLRDLAAQAPQAGEQKKPGIVAHAASGTFNLESWIEQHIPHAGPREPWQGGSRWIVNPCIFDENHTGTSAAIVRNAAGVIAYTCQHNGCSSRTWHDVRERLDPAANRVKPFRPKGEQAPAEPEPWPEPVPFDAPILLPDFPLEALPPELGDFASEVAQTVQVPVDLPASLSLAVASATVARRYVVAVGETHEEPTNIYVVGAMTPGTRKSETFRRCLSPLEEIEEERSRAAAPDIKRAQARRDVAESRVKELKNQIAKAKKGTGDAQRIELEELAANLPEVPAEPKEIVSDETAEHLTTTLARQGGRIAMFDADSGLFEILAGRYSAAPNFEVYLKAHAGDTIRVGRTTRDGDFVKRPALTMGVCVQPDVVAGCAGTPGFRGRGLLGRILWTVPADTVGSRVYANRPLSAVAAATYRETIRTTYGLPSAGEDRPHRLLLTGKALAEWTAFANRIEAEQREGERLAGIRDWASKAAGAAARIAGVFHVIRYRTCRPAAPWELEIDPDTVAAANAVVDYFTEHALAAYALMEVDERVALARRLLRWIERVIPNPGIFKPRGPKGEVGFTLRDCHRHHRAVGRPEDLLPGLDLLEGRGYLRRLPPPEPRPAHRPPSPVFLISPLWTEVPEVPEVHPAPVERSAGA
ncbi:MAG: DUF3987 domain-containing protein [Thermoanaerobaculia bacterium]|nr:DUF3987 domain-containing protein [Thermoanaerobaculia bacterium]